jgi:hypothetical protein
VFDEDGEGALRHAPETDAQYFVFKFQHDKFVLARYFVQKNFPLQEFIKKKGGGIRVSIFMRPGIASHQRSALAERSSGGKARPTT